jgi:CHAT domain-containing protein
MKYDAGVENDAIDATAPASRKIFDTRSKFIDEVFKTEDFDLLHYFGHSGEGAEKGPRRGRYLSFAQDEETLRLQEIGALEEERAFFSRNPLIVLNCCDGIQTSALIGGPESFPHSFIDNACIACVGTTWPVDSRAGNRFMIALYAHLAEGDFLHIAVMKARRDLLDRAKESAEPEEKLYLTLAARAYVYYGPPDLKCVFAKRAP